MSLSIEIAGEQRKRFDLARVKKAVRAVLKDAGIKTCEVSIAIVSDKRMQELNRKYLKHDYPTDVLTFVLTHSAARAALDGEIIVSADYAAREAPRYDWSADDELLLYVIHGSLHLVGYDDTKAAAKREMRKAEAAYLQQFGLKHRFQD